MISSLELAKICKVSQATVARAINNKGRIAESTRKRILEAAKKYNYAPNPAIREFMFGKSKVIGVAVSSFDSSFSMEYIQTISDTVSKKGYQLFVAAAQGEEKLYETLRMFATRRFAAGIVIPDLKYININESELDNFKILSLVHKSEGKSVTSLLANEEKSMETALECLMNKGHKNIMYLGYPDIKLREEIHITTFKNFMKNNNLNLCVCKNIPENSKLRTGLWSKNYQNTIDEDNLMNIINKHKPSAIILQSPWLMISLNDILTKRHIIDNFSFLALNNDSSLEKFFNNIAFMQYPYCEFAEQIVPFIENEISEFKIPNYTLIKTKNIKNIPEKEGDLLR